MTESPRIVVSGKRGQVGLDICRLLTESGIPFQAFDRSEWDIGSLDDCSSVFQRTLPHIVINCAAYTAVDRAEEERSEAFRANATGTRNLVRLCREFGAFLVHYSTDYVFSSFQSRAGQSSVVSPWRTDDARSPHGAYAESKAAGEDEILTEANGSALVGAAIVRTSWVYGATGRNFLTTILKLASDPNRESLAVVDDQIGRPTHTRLLAEFTLSLLRSKNLLSVGATSASSVTGGIYHCSNSGAASWFDFAHAILEIAHAKGLLPRRPHVRPISSKEYPTKARRPGFSVLDLTSSMEILPSIPHWRDDLARCIGAMRRVGENEPA